MIFDMVLHDIHMIYHMIPIPHDTSDTKYIMKFDTSHDIPHDIISRFQVKRRELILLLSHDNRMIYQVHELDIHH